MRDEPAMKTSWHDLFDGSEMEQSEMEIDYKTMFEQAVSNLAAIDDALGIGDDGCGNGIEDTLAAIDELKIAARVGIELARTVMTDGTGSA